MYPVKVAEELSDTEEPEQEPLNVVTMDPNSAEQVIAAYETGIFLVGTVTGWRSLSPPKRVGPTFKTLKTRENTR